MSFFRRLRMPTPYTVLVLFLLVAAAGTWLMPAGKYDMLTYDGDEDAFVIEATHGTERLPATQETLDSLGITIALEKLTSGAIYRPIAVPETYTRREAAPQGFVAIAKSPVQGIYDAIDVILFVLIIGGFIGAFRATGVFESGVHWLAQRLRGRESLLVIVVTGLIAIGGTTFGMAEETLAFYPLLVPIFLAAGYDALVPVAAIYGGSTIGTMFSSVNPFAVIIASDAAGVSWTTGIEWRLAGLIIGTAICILYILRYARRVRRDPSRSLLHGRKVEPPATADVQIASELPPGMGVKQWLLTAFFALTFLVMIIGVSRLHWWFLEMTTLFLVAAIIVGFLAGKGEKKFITAFLKGAEEMLGVAIIIGIARGVTILLNNGQISDTMLYLASSVVEGMPAIAFIAMLFVIFFILTFFISSSSGLAVLTMPVMGPLARVVNVPAQHVVNAYLAGLGLMTFITPTGLILPSLVMVDVGYGTWLRFIAPLLVILAAFSLLFLSAGILLTG